MLFEGSSSVPFVRNSVGVGSQVSPVLRQSKVLSQRFLHSFLSTFIVHCENSSKRVCVGHKHLFSCFSFKERMKTKLTLEPVNGGPFNCRPGHEIELEDERILCNDVRLCHYRTNYRNVHLWVIGNEFGPLCAVWAGSEQGALDVACDANLLGGLAINEEDADGETARLGNAGEPHDLTYAWMQTVRLNGPEDWELIARFAEARGACADTLDK